MCAPCYPGPVLYVTYEEEEPPQVDDPNYFFEGDPGEPPDPEPTDCDNPDANNETDPDPALCGGGSSPSALNESSAATASAGQPVTWSPNPWSPSARVVKFRNADGIWWIYNRCVDYTQGGDRYNVGPGYIARVTRNAGTQKYVDDFRARTAATDAGLINAVHGGLGTLGWHHTRGPENNSPAGDDPTTPEVEQQVDRLAPGYVIEGRMCALKNANNGVCNVTFPNDGPKLIQTNRPHVDYTVDVWLRDSAGGTGCVANALARVRYRYSFYRSAVKSWISVTLYPRANPPEGRRFVKEPKLTATLDDRDYKRMSIFGNANGRCFISGAMRGNPSVQTNHSGTSARVRVRWDYGTEPNRVSPGSCTDPQPSVCQAGPCFNVIMRAYRTSSDGNITRHQKPFTWENGVDEGFDSWAVRAQSRAKTWPRDTHGGPQPAPGEPGPVSSCQYPTDPNRQYTPAELSQLSANSHPARQEVREWEHVGFKAAPNQGETQDNNSNPYSVSATFFHAWEDGAGPGDCEPLERGFSSNRESFGTFAIYSINDGWDSSLAEFGDLR